MSNEQRSLIEHARRVMIELLNIFDDMLINAGYLKCRTIPSKEDRARLKQLKEL